MAMTLIQSDYEDISLFIIDECKKRKLDLNESSRKCLISKALGIFCNQGLRIMREQMLWEISLLAPANMERATDSPLEICDKGKMRQKKYIMEYLYGIGCKLYHNSRIYYTILPKTYSRADIKKRITLIQNR